MDTNHVDELTRELARIVGPGFDMGIVGRVRQIGEELNDTGGMSLMIETSMKASALNPRVRGFLGKHWDGIGDWVD